MRLFAIRDFRHLFGAQIIALFGTGLATVALGLLAYDPVSYTHLTLPTNREV